MSLFNLYADSALTTLFSAGRHFLTVGDTPVDNDGVFYIGSTTATAVLQMESDPGVDIIYAAIVDADTESGLSSSMVKLAASAIDLDTAVAGDPLALGHTINGGVVNAVPVHYRLTPGAQSAGKYDDLSIAIDGLIEFDNP